MPPQTDFPLVFEKLKAILKPYAKNLTTTADTSAAYSLEGTYSEKYKRVLFFGSVQIKKNYVSFYLMPVYMFPDLPKAYRSNSKNTCRANPGSTSKRLNLNSSKNLLT